MFIVPEDNEKHPRLYYDRHIEKPEHAHLFTGQPLVAFLYRVEPLKEQGRQIIGSCSMPQVQGRHRNMFAWMVERLFGFMPDFLFTLDHDYWHDVPDLHREILMFHEMMHAAQATNAFGAPRYHRETGKPVWCIKGHDVEEFTAVAARYGAWQPEIASFVAAVNQKSQFNHE